MKAINKTEDYNRDEQMLKPIQESMLHVYPQLKIRWARILGRRWSHIGGNSGGVWLGSKQYRLNSEYGICIDNADDLKQDELENLINQLQEKMLDDRHS